MSNSLLSGFEDADSEDEIIEMSSDSTMFPVNPLYQSTTFTSTSTTLPATPQTTPTMAMLPLSTVTATILQPSTLPTSSIPMPITRPFAQSNPQIYSSSPSTPIVPTLPTSQGTFIPQTTPLQPQTTPLQPQTTPLQPQIPLSQAQQPLKATSSVTLPQLQQAQQQIIYRLKQLKELIQQAQVQKQSMAETSSTTPSSPSTQSSQTPTTPIPLVAGGSTSSAPLYTMLPQLVQQQQALVQKYHQTQQQIQLLTGGKPTALSTTPPGMTTQKQINLVWQKLQELQQQIQMATKLAGPSTPTSSSTPNAAPTPNPTVLALQRQQQILAKQYQQLLQLQAKTPPNGPVPPSNIPPTNVVSIPIPPVSSHNTPPSNIPQNTSPLALLQMNAAMQTTTSLAPASMSSPHISKLQKALVKHGTNFSVLSTALGTKSSSQVRKFYHQSGGAKGSFRLYLAEHHRLKKNEGVLDAYNLDLTPAEEELVKQGKLPEINPLSSSQSFLPPPPLLSSSSSTISGAGGDMTPPDIFEAPPPDKDPLEGMDDVQKKEYKRKRAEQIFAANDRGIFQTNEDGETEVAVHSPKKARRPLKVATGPGAHTATLPSPRTNSSAKSFVYKKIDPGGEK